MIADRVDRLLESPPLLGGADTDPLRARRRVLSLRHDMLRHSREDVGGYTSPACTTGRISAAWAPTVAGCRMAVVIMLVALLSNWVNLPGAAAESSRLPRTSASATEFA